MPRARELFEQVIELSQQSHVQTAMTWGLAGLAAAWASDNPLLSARLVGKAETIAEQAGHVLYGFESRRQQDIIAGLLTSLGADTFQAAREDGRALSLDELLAAARRSPTHP